MSVKTFHAKNVTLVQGVFDTAFFDLLKKKKVKEAVVLEGRPTLEAAKRNSQQLLKRKIKPILISDNMAGFFFYKNFVKEVWLAAQKSDEKGALGHIGALMLAVLARRHKVPVYTFKAQKETELFGHKKDIFSFNGIKTAPEGIHAYVPLVEWVPRKYIKEAAKDE